jgi:hypothetical protein
MTLVARTLTEIQPRIESKHGDESKPFELRLPGICLLLRFQSDARDTAGNRGQEHDTPLEDTRARVQRLPVSVSHEWVIELNLSF